MRRASAKQPIPQPGDRLAKWVHFTRRSSSILAALTICVVSFGATYGSFFSSNYQIWIRAEGVAGLIFQLTLQYFVTFGMIAIDIWLGREAKKSVIIRST